MVKKMRIVSGKYKRRQIAFPQENKKQPYETRPTKDRVREAIFNALGNDCQGEKVLDLFAGSGALGIEALSRDACFADFVDIRPEAVACLKENIRNLAISNAKIWKGDYADILSQMKEEKRTFSLIFLDPPYHMDVYHEVMRKMEEMALLEENYTFVLESDHAIEDLETEEEKEIRRYHYGFIHVTIIKRK